MAIMKKKQKKPMPIWARLAIIIILIITAFLCFVILSEDTTSNEATAQDKENTHTQEESINIVDSNTVSAEFLGFSDHPELDMFLVSMRVTNKIDQPIVVFMEDASVNDEMMQMVMTGVPLRIQPNKRGSNGFIFNYNQISIDDLDDVKSVSFKLRIANDDTLADIWTSPEITLTK